MSMRARLEALTEPAVLMRLPLIGIGIVVLYVAVETARRGTIAAAPFETTSEAIAGENPARALELMAMGARIDAVASVRAGLLDPLAVDVTPLEAAILSRRLEAVDLLLHSGADPSRNPRAICLARLRLPEALPLLGEAAVNPEQAVTPAAAIAMCSRPVGESGRQPGARATAFAGRLDVR